MSVHNVLQTLNLMRDDIAKIEVALIDKTGQVMTLSGDNFDRLSREEIHHVLRKLMEQIRRGMGEEEFMKFLANISKQPEIADLLLRGGLI